jgi:hypothetical protein
LQARCLCFLHILAVLLRLACLVLLPIVSRRCAILYRVSGYSFPIDKHRVYVAWTV